MNEQGAADEHGGFEADRLDLRAYYLALAATALVTLLIVWLVSAVFPRFEPALSRPIVTPVPRSERMPEPHLQLDPAGEMQAQHAAELARLSSYGWVDREHGVLHIPIELAMQRLLERGLPQRSSAAPAPAQGAR